MKLKKEDLWREGYTESDLILGKTVIKRTDDLSCEELESMTEKLTHRLNSRTTKKRKLLTPLGMNEFTTESWVTPL